MLFYVLLEKPFTYMETPQLPQNFSNRGISLSCHICCDTEHWLMQSYSKDCRIEVACYDKKRILTASSNPDSTVQTAGRGGVL